MDGYKQIVNKTRLNFELSKIHFREPADIKKERLRRSFFAAFASVHPGYEALPAVRNDREWAAGQDAQEIRLFCRRSNATSGITTAVTATAATIPVTKRIRAAPKTSAKV